VVHNVGTFKPLLMPGWMSSETTLCGWWAGWMSPIRWWGTGPFLGSAVAVVSDESHGVLKVHFRASSRNGLSFDSP
jgi:hypothetical protein